MSFLHNLGKLSDKDRLIKRSKDEKELQESDFKDLNPIASDDMVAVYCFSYSRLLVQYHRGQIKR